MPDEALITVTFKFGPGHGDPWAVLRAADESELDRALAIAESRADKIVTTANVLHAVHSAGPLLTPEPAPAPVIANPAAVATTPSNVVPNTQQAWGASRPATGGPREGDLHPEQKSCRCGAILAFKIIRRKSDGKSWNTWSCPLGRSKDDGHETEFIR